MYKFLKNNLTIFLSILLINSIVLRFISIIKLQRFMKNQNLPKKKLLKTLCIKVKNGPRIHKLLNDDLLGYKITGYHDTQKIAAPKNGISQFHLITLL